MSVGVEAELLAPAGLVSCFRTLSGVSSAHFFLVSSCLFDKWMPLSMCVSRLTELAFL